MPARRIRFSVPFTSSKIPHCSEDYWIDVSNGITVMNGVSPVTADTNKNYTLTIHGKRINKPIEWLVAFTYIPLYESQSFAHTWNVGFKSKSDGQINQKNLYWIPPKGGTLCPENNNFYVIPGYSRHGVSEDGLVFARHTSSVLMVRRSNTKIDNPYILATCWSEFGNKETLMVHRAIGLAVLEYPEPPDNMTIDHVNGVKADNYKSNLEWVTYAQNNIRAMNLGLRKARIPVIVRDYKTRKDYWYRSVSDAAIDIGINSGGLHRNAVKFSDKLLSGRYKVRFETNSDSIDDAAFEFVVVGEGKKDCIGRNIDTDETFVCKNEYGLSEITGLKPREIRNLMWGDKCWPLKGWLIRRLNNATDINRQYTALELKMIRTGEQIVNPFYVTDLETDKKTIHPSLVGACKIILGTVPQNIDFKSFSKESKQKIKRNGKHYLFEIIEH